MQNATGRFLFRSYIFLVKTHPSDFIANPNCHGNQTFSRCEIDSCERSKGQMWCSLHVAPGMKLTRWPFKLEVWNRQSFDLETSENELWGFVLHTAWGHLNRSLDTCGECICRVWLWRGTFVSQMKLNCLQRHYSIDIRCSAEYRVVCQLPISSDTVGWRRVFVITISFICFFVV